MSSGDRVIVLEPCDRVAVANSGRHVAALRALASAGLSVPPWFALSFRLGRASRTARRFLPSPSLDTLRDRMIALERATGTTFGRGPRPLLVAVRTSASATTLEPGDTRLGVGTLETVLDVGTNDEVAASLGGPSGLARFGESCHERSLVAFACSVMGLPREEFERVRREHSAQSSETGGASSPQARLVERFRHLAERLAGMPIEVDPWTQLRLAVEAGVRSWYEGATSRYCEPHPRRASSGVTVTIQAMVFGSRSPRSCAGRVFTRDPTTGENRLYGEFLPESQGDDLSAGVRVPEPIDSLRRFSPMARTELVCAKDALERHLRGVVECEFVLDDGRMWFLDVRRARATPTARVRFAVDLARQGVLTPRDAAASIDVETLWRSRNPVMAVPPHARPVSSGVCVGFGKASGRLSMSVERAREFARDGKDTILLVDGDTFPHAVESKHLRGLIQRSGGMESLVAVVSRGHGLPVIDASSATLLGDRSIRWERATIHEGDVVAIDAEHGKLWSGVPMRQVTDPPTRWHRAFARIVRAVDDPALPLRSRRETARLRGLCAEIVARRRGRDEVAADRGPPLSARDKTVGLRADGQCAGPTFRLFVSSTFSDFKRERDALEERVWPRLRELCRAKGARFLAVDLRWGVSEEAARDQRTMEICLREIDRCRDESPPPGFLVLVGRRYGWRPLPSQLDAAEFAKVARRLPPAQRALARHWYRLDRNAIPPVRVLRERRPTMPESSWQRIEQQLRDALEAGSRSRGRLSGDLWLRGASATEHEIARGPLSAADALHRTVVVLRDMRGVPSTGVERDLVDLLPDGRVDMDARRRVERLRGALARRFGRQVIDIEADGRDEGATSHHIVRMCDEVERRLTRMIHRHLATLAVVDPDEQELRHHREFGERKREHFVGRQGALDRIRTYLRSDEPGPLVVVGESGSGKSALMAQAAATLVPSGARRLLRFVGATPASSDARSLLLGLLRELECRSDAGDTRAGGGERLADRVRKALAQGASDQDVVVFVDALDQLSPADAAWTLNWVPSRLSRRVRLVVSIRPGGPSEAISRRFMRTRLALEPFSSEDAMKAVDALLAAAKRTLAPAQRSALRAGIAACPLPLYVRLAVERARQCRSFDEFGRLPHDVRGLFREFLADLSRESSHGRVLVARSLGLLAAARHGLAEDELLDVLSSPAESVVADDFRRRSPKSPTVSRLPVVVWSRLRHDLGPYLVERAADGTTVLGFFHQQLRDVVESDFLRGAARRARHASLAAYFRSPPRNCGGRSPFFDRRALAERVHHEIRSGDPSGVETTLLETSPFLVAKVAAGMHDELADDFRAAASLRRDRTGRRALRLVAATIDLSSGLLANRPDQFVTHLHGRLASTQDARIRRLLSDSALHTIGPWLRATRSSLVVAGGVELRTIDAGRPVTAVAVTSDGRRLVAGFGDGSIGVWDGVTGAVLRALSAHKEPVEAIAISPDDRTVVSSARDFVQTWDLDRGERLRTIRGPFAGDLLAISSDGAMATIASTWHGALALLDLARGSVVRHLGPPAAPASVATVGTDGRHAVVLTIEGFLERWDLLNGSRCRAVSVRRRLFLPAIVASRDGRRVVTSDGERLQVWDLDGRRPVRRLRRRARCHVEAFRWSPDGRYVALTTDQDHAIELCGVRPRDPDRRLEGHTSTVRAVAFGADRRLVVSGGDDGMIKQWDLRGRVQPRSADSHVSAVVAVAAATDVPVGVSGDRGGTVKCWDLRDGAARRAIACNPGLLALAISSDGRTLAAGSSDGSIAVYDLETGQRRAGLRGHLDAVRSVALVGDRVVSASEDRSLRVWTVDGVERSRIASAHLGGIRSLSVSADGRRAVTGSWDCQVGVWDLDQQRPVRVLVAHADWVNSVVLSPDGACAVSGSGDGHWIAWSADSGRRRRNVAAHVGWIHGVSMSQDARHLVTASDDRSLRCWNLASGDPVCEFVAEVRFLSVAFGPGETLIAGDDAGRVHVLRLESAAASPARSAQAP